MQNMINEELLTELIDLGERLSEDRLYEVVIDEIERDEFDSVAKAKALEEAEGDQNKARAFYTKHRVRRIRDLIAEAEIAAEAEKMRAEEELKRHEAELQQQRADQQGAKERTQTENWIAGCFWFICSFFCLVMLFYNVRDFVIDGQDGILMIAAGVSALLGNRHIGRAKN